MKMQEKGVWKFIKRKRERCIYQSRKEVQEQFGKMMNQYVNRNRKLFWKEISKDNSNRIKDGNGRLALEEAEVRRIWKEYSEDLCNIYIPRNRLQSTCVALMGFRERTT